MKNFIPIRILSSWSKTMSVFYVTFADTNNVKESKLTIKKVCNTISLNWDDNSSKYIKIFFFWSKLNFYF